MYKNKYKDNYIAVINSLKTAQKESSDDGYTRLYLTDRNGLTKLPYLEISNIIKSLKKEGFISINHCPNDSDLIEDNVQHFHSPEVEKILREANILKIYPYPVWPKNYFSLTLEEKFINKFISNNSLISFLSTIPGGKKFKNSRIITELLIDDTIVENYKIATSIKIKGKYSKKRIRVTKKDYLRNKTEYNQLIENCLKTLRKQIGPYGYKIQFNSAYTKLLKISSKNSPTALKSLQI